MRERIGRHKKGLGLVALGVVIGSLMVSPVGAHVGGTISHLWGAPGHLKGKVQTFADGRYPRFGGTLPRGQVQTGSWYGMSSTGDGIGASISFPARLGFNPDTIVIPAGGPTETGCTGTASNPTAAPGKLCIYVGYASNAQGIEIYTTANGANICNAPPTPTTPVCRHGVAVFAAKMTPANFGEMGGTYAVRAPA